MREVYSVEIKGLKPYLMHAFKGDNGTESKKRGAHPTIEQDCEEALYRMTDKTIFVPSLQLEASMKNASKDYKFKGRSSYWGLVTAAVSVEPLEIPIEPQHFEPFVTGVVINDARIMKGRPMFKNWSLKFNIAVTDERLKEAQLNEILKEAGQSRGIGDWRPKFGLYEITSWKKA